MARTLVATPGGEVPIEALQVGDRVQAQTPPTGTVEAEPVGAVIADGVKPLLAVVLSDSEALTVTADHPFYVVRGMRGEGRRWLAAGDLLPGDRLREASGRTMGVAGLRRGVGRAAVYTLTVASDHTYFLRRLRSDARTKSRAICIVQSGLRPAWGRVD